MKRTALVLSGLFVIAVLAVAVSWAKPNLVPEWARFGRANGTRSEDSGIFCKEHGVPEKFCTLCHPELKEKLLLCKEHGDIPEDICTLCHPELAKKHAIELCPNGHGLPKHFCYKCDEAAGKPRASTNLFDDGFCKAFGGTTKDGKTVCQLLPVVRLASADLANEVGFTTARVVEEEHAHEFEAPAETAYNANRYAEVTPRLSGFLREVRYDLGQEVKEGETLLVVDSAEVSTAKSKYLAGKDALSLAEHTQGRVESLVETAILSTTGKDRRSALSAVNQAKASMLNAEQRLRNYHFDDAALASILKTSDTTPFLDVKSPVSGTVVNRRAVMGEAVEPTTKLYTVADISKVWLWIDVFERDIRQVKLGQPVTFTVHGTNSAREERSYHGAVTWIGSEVDPKTRTTKVRAELPNSDRSLRAHQFGRATVQISERHKALTVPKGAVQRYENVDMVFLKEKDGVYRPQRIRSSPLGKGETLEVAWGVKQGQEVVVAGSFLLKTEIMKGSIGAGCCD